jgi:hypothetical protein
MEVSGRRSWRGRTDPRNPQPVSGPGPNFGFPLGPDRWAPPLESDDFDLVSIMFKAGDQSNGFRRDPTQKPKFHYTWIEDPDSPLTSIISGTISGTLDGGSLPSDTEKRGPSFPITFTLEFRGAPYATTQEQIVRNCDGVREPPDSSSDHDPGRAPPQGPSHGEAR